MAFNTYPCNPWPISTEQLNKGNNDDLNTRVAALESEVSDLNDTKANQITIAPFFDPEASYEVGDLVYYNGLSYRCTNDHEGEWDADDFAATTISNELDTLKSGLTNYSFADNITTHATWVETSIIDITDYAGRVIYGYMTDATVGVTYTFAVPVNNMPGILSPIWVKHDGSATLSESIFVGKLDTNGFGVYLGTNIPDMTLYLFIH